MSLLLPQRGERMSYDWFAAMRENDKLKNDLLFIFFMTLSGLFGIVLGYLAAKGVF